MKKIVALTLSCALAGTLFLSACSVERVDTSTDPDAAGSTAATDMELREMALK